MVAAAMNFIINIATVKTIGLYAGSISTLISFMFLAFFRMYNVRKFQPMNYKYSKMLLSFAVIGGMCFLCYINTLQTNIANFIIGILFAAFLNKKFIKSVREEMVKKLKKSETSKRNV
jgi:O-antigen/teichoic acid export membrane protein